MIVMIKEQLKKDYPVFCKDGHVRVNWIDWEIVLHTNNTILTPYGIYTVINTHKEHTITKNGNKKVINWVILRALNNVCYALKRTQLFNKNFPRTAVVVANTGLQKDILVSMGYRYVFNHYEPCIKDCADMRETYVPNNTTVDLVRRNIFLTTPALSPDALLEMTTRMRDVKYVLNHFHPDTAPIHEYNNLINDDDGNMVKVKDYIYAIALEQYRYLKSHPWKIDTDDDYPLFY